MDDGGEHPHPPAASFDGGDLDCGNGLLLLIRRHIDPLPPSGLLEIVSSEPSVPRDLAAWCRLTGNELVSEVGRGPGRRSFLVSKGAFVAPEAASPSASPAPPPSDPTVEGEVTSRASLPPPRPLVEVLVPDTLPVPSPAPTIAPLSVLGIGSWPRPRWLLRDLHEFLEGRLAEEEFQASADDAVRLAVDAQLRAGVDVLSDGEQRRDNYSSFVGGRLDNCQLIPLTDLLPYVDHPDEFAEQMDSLDVPAEKVRHPAVFGRLGRRRPLAVHELDFVRGLADVPVKVALPGPYLLTRTMWMECISDQAYADREELAVDIVRVLREELHFLLAAGAALVQFDEPVLTEVVHGGPSDQRSFMCGALGHKREAAEELDFAAGLFQDLVRGLPADRLAVHVCRGNWTPDESAALHGGYEPLVETLSRLPVGTLFLEFRTPRAGREDVLARLPDSLRVGVGVVNQKEPRVETVDEIVAKAQGVLRHLDRERLLLVPDCGFATFADNPISSAAVAEAKLRAMAEARDRLRESR